MHYLFLGALVFGIESELCTGPEQLHLVGLVLLYLLTCFMFIQPACYCFIVLVVSLLPAVSVKVVVASYTLRL